jgi:urease accessory protein
MRDPVQLLLLLQYGDSAYPAGAYAHSWGLETAVAEGHVRDAATVAAVCDAMLRHQVARADAVAAAECSRAAADEDLAAFVEVDRRLSATRAASETRTASTRIGRRLLETATTAERLTWLERIRAHVRSGETPGNHACVLGAIAGLHGQPPVDAAGLVLWTSASAFLSAAPRLVRITHDDVQAILTSRRATMAALALQAARADPAEMAGGAPQLEIWAMRHETGSARLFAS